MRHTLTSAQGFTIVELLVVVVVAGIMMALIFGPMDDIYRSQSVEMKTLVQQTDTKSALNTIAKDASLATGFQKSDALDPVGPPLPASETISKKWNTPNYSFEGSGPDNRILIFTKYATNESADSLDRKLLLVENCSLPLQNVFIFFVDNGVLWRRSVPGAQMSNCSYPGASGLSNSTRQSCPLSRNIGVCQGKDAKIIDHVTKFQVDYFQQATGGSTGSVQIPTSGDIESAAYIRVTIEIETGTANNKSKTTDSMVITRVNREGAS